MKAFFRVAVFMLSCAPTLAAARDVTLAVDGMDCAACPITVRKALERLDGVKVTKIDMAAGTMEISVADDTVADAQLLKATADVGYRSQILGARAGPAANSPALNHTVGASLDLPAMTGDLQPLRSAFNRARGSHRILAVVSPTCGACRLGVEAIKASVLSDNDPQLRVFVIWSPMLKRDNEGTAREAAATLNDPRVQQFLDLSRHVGSALRQDLFPEARAAMLGALPPDHYFREYAEASKSDKPEWDIYLSFPDDALWSDRVPTPDRWIRQTALYPNDQGQQISLLWLDSYAVAPVEGDLVQTMRRLLR